MQICIGYIYVQEYMLFRYICNLYFVFKVGEIEVFCICILKYIYHTLFSLYQLQIEALYHFRIGEILKCNAVEMIVILTFHFSRLIRI